MKNKIHRLFIVLVCFSNLLIAQDGINLNTDEAIPSYTLFETDISTSTFLIDNCGEVVNEWTNTFGADLHPKLLPNGHLLYIRSNTIYEVDWDGTTVKRIDIQEQDLRIVYEVIVLPTGNYLCVSRRYLSQSEFTEMGYDLSNASPYRIDGVVEIDSATEEIVWEWNMMDHVIQERDSDAGNYGVVADHPELFNMDAVSHYDWNFTESFMINGMGYNPELDQIVLSIRKMSEIVIIDHSTTTAEAASHSGGKYGKGGDILYRWGNPQNYGRGTASDRFLFFQHNPHWVTEGPHKGKLICYNNGLNRPGVPFGDEYSNVPIINTPVDADGNYPLDAVDAFAPAAPDLIYSENTTNTPFFSGYTSGVRLFPNGNLFITEGVRGRTFEINSTGKKIWQYTVPETSYIFRAEKYPLDYPAFDGKDLVPSGDVPQASNSYDCQLTTSVDDVDLKASPFSINYIDAKTIEIINPIAQDFSYELYDLHGRRITEGQSFATSHQLSLHTLPSGLYVLTIADGKKNQWIAHKILIRG